MMKKLTIDELETVTGGIEKGGMPCYYCDSCGAPAQPPGPNGTGYQVDKYIWHCNACGAEKELKMIATGIALG